MNIVECREVLQNVRALIVDELPNLLGRRYEIRYKEDGSPVTSADVYLEERIRALLAGLNREISLIGEESFRAGAVMSSDLIAVLDPIDGTENFCSGMKEWGVSFGVWNGTEHLGSFLFMPELGEFLSTGEKVLKIRSRITGFSSSYCDAITTGIREASEYRVTGCAVYNILNVIRGSFCRFVNPKGAYIWDLLPGIMLALENGCEVLINDEKYNGKFLDPNRKYRVDIRHR